LTDFANSSPPEAYYLRNSLQYSSAAYNFKWHITPRHNADMGFKAVFNNVSPGEIEPLQSHTLINYSKLNNEKLLEWTVYAGDEFEVLPNLSVTAGVRYSWAGNIGQPVVYLYEQDKPLDQANVSDSLIFGKNDVAASYSGFEPRLMLSYDFNSDNTLKFNYQRDKIFFKSVIRQ
jgi:outer membrane receptor protein involved in Fe transport